MSRREALIAPLLLLESCVTMSPVAEPTSQFVNSVAFVDASIDGSEDLTFLIDTGASASAIDEKVAARLSLPVGGSTTVEGSAGTIDAQLARIGSVRIGGLTSGPITPTVSDLSNSLSPSGQPIAGILGYDVLQQFAVEFRPANGTVRLATNPKILIAGRPHETVRFTLDNNIPLVPVRIRGLPASMRLDSGASIGDGPRVFANITSAFYDRIMAAEPGLKPYTHFTASGTGGTIDIPVLPGGPLNIGSRQVDDVRLIVQPATGYFARPDSVGFLGLYSLKAWRSVIVDYPGRQLILVD